MSVEMDRTYMHSYVCKYVVFVFADLIVYQNEQLCMLFSAHTFCDAISLIATFQDRLTEMRNSVSNAFSM
jgi:hypothetical protein